MSSRMVRAIRPLPSPSALGFLETRGAVRQRVRVSPGTSGGEAVAVASLSPHDRGGGRNHSPCHSHSGMGWGGAAVTHPCRNCPPSALAEWAHWDGHSDLAECWWPPWPLVASYLHANLGSLNSRVGQGPTHMAFLPTVCNFMSHEKCLKHVKTPCTSVAPSLVRVRTEFGLPHCWEGPRGGDRLVVRTAAGLGGSVPLCRLGPPS